MQRNEFYMEDDWFQFGWPSKEGIFYKISKSQFRPQFFGDQSNLLLENLIYLSSGVLTHKRKMYDIVALLGDLGGVTEVLMLMLGFILF